VFQDAAADSIPRHELIATALQLGIERPDSLSNAELSAAIQRASEQPSAETQPASGTWFAVARHLVASVVEQGLNLPGAAKMIRGVAAGLSGAARQRPPLPTVTLAQIYLAQGHNERARSTLVQVLSRHPENQKAKRLLQALEESEHATSGGADAVNPETAVNSETLTAETVEGEAPGSSSGSVLSEGGGLSGGSVLSEVVRPPRHKPTDLVVVLAAKNTARVCWELSEASATLLGDQGLELVVKVVGPGLFGPVLREERFQVAVPSGLRGVRREDGEEIRAALVDSAGIGLLILDVATVFEVDDNTTPVLVFEPIVDGAARAATRREQTQRFAERLVSSLS
jgi:hypothetical protein